MSGPSPICTVNGSAPPQDVTGGSSVAIVLTNPAGANFWFLQCTSADETTSVSTINASISINLTNHTATLTAPNGAGSAIILTSTVGIANGSSLGAGLDQNFVVQPSFTTTFKVTVPTAGGFEVLAYGETFEQDATHGNIVEVNALIRGATGSSFVAPSFLRLTNGTAGGTPTVTQSAPNQSGVIALCDTTSAWGNPFRLPTGSNANDAFEITLVDSKNKWPTNALTVTTDTGSVPIVDPAQIGGAGGTANSLSLGGARASVRFKYAKTEGLYVVV